MLFRSITTVNQPTLMIYLYQRVSYKRGLFLLEGDVYKRQRMVFLYLISKGCENMEKSLEQLKPVSYTHLDVYKRQPKLYQYNCEAYKQPASPGFS